jgi:hypothetical protein
LNHPPLPIIVRPRVKTKLLEHRDYYNAREAGLGNKFYTEMLDALAWVQANYKRRPSFAVVRISSAMSPARDHSAG